MKKRILFLLIVIALTISMLPAAVTEGNRQKIYPVDSDIYKAIKYLYIAEGLALPSTTGPWTGMELDIMLNRIDYEKLNESEKQTYSFIASRLGKAPRINPDKNFGLNIGMKVALEGLLHTNPAEFDSTDDFGGKGDWRETTPMFTFPLETWIGNNVYGYSPFSLGINRTYKEGLDDRNFFTNIYLVPPCVMDDLNFSIPFRAIGSIGSESWNFAIGRDRLSWGPGESGNLLVGDQILYHDNARFSAFSDHFKYTFSMSSFPHPTNYTTDTGKLNKDPESHLISYSQKTEKEGLNMYIAHRLEWRIINRINMALTEAIMYQSKSNHLDLQVLSPTAIFHNYYIRGNANSIISLEIDVTPVEHLNIYGELAIDEFKLPGEFTSEGPPSASGFLLGAKTGVALGDGIFYSSVEGAYTDPYLYLRDNPAASSNGYGINFIVATKEWQTEDFANYDLNPIGYRYGNDTIVANLNAGYEVFGKWKLDARYTYIADGCMDINSIWQEIEGDENCNAPTTSHPGSGNYDPDANTSLRNAVAHWNVLSLTGKITLLNNMDLWAEMNYINIQNYRNEQDRKTDDVQFVLGMSYYI